MAELRTPGERSQEKPPFDPPRGDEGLDDWFARRLESQGIKARRARIPVARIVAVVALVAALIALVFVLKAASSTSTTTAIPPSATQPTAPASTTTSTTPVKAKKPLWKRVKLTVLNGFGGTNAAGTVKLELQKAGWTVLGVGDAAPDTVATIVVYVPGFLNQARVVATRLGLPSPVPISQATGVVPTQTDSVAIVLGDNLLPNGAG